MDSIQRPVQPKYIYVKEQQNGYCYKYVNVTS